jgi:hypothetical protein
MKKDAIKTFIFLLFSMFFIPKISEFIIILPTKILPVSTAKTLGTLFSNLNELYFIIFLNIIGIIWISIYIIIQRNYLEYLK